MSENENCSSYIGVYIGEKKFAKQLLSIIFEDVKEKKYGNPGFDFICTDPRQEFLDRYPQFRLERDKEYKINVKTVRLIDNKWSFTIRNDNRPDYFFLIAIGSEYEEENIDIVHIWIFKKDEFVEKKIGGRYIITKFYDRHGIIISDKIDKLSEFHKNELKEELERLKNILKS